MVKEYTICELSEVLNISKQATDKKIKKLELAGLKTTIRSINNRPTKIVFLSDEQLNDLINNTLNNVVASQPEININQPVNQPEQSTNQQLHILLAEYAFKAGKYELLEDKSQELKNDVVHWQEEYFRLKFELELLQKNHKELEEENKKLKKKSGLFGIFKK